MKKVLLVEDDPALRMTLAGALRQAGFTMYLAADGMEALRLAETEKPKLILLDIILPKQSGFDVLKKLKSSEATREIPVVVLTNLESADDVDQALAQGAKNFLVKANYELNDIVAKVRQLFDQSGS